jgi:hypothetical protein
MANNATASDQRDAATRDDRFQLFKKLVVRIEDRARPKLPRHDPLDTTGIDSGVWYTSRIHNA